MENEERLVATLDYYQEMHRQEGAAWREAYNELLIDRDDYFHSYHRIMELLRASKQEHGLCSPRERKACAACNAQDTIDHLVGEYKGAPMVRSESNIGEEKC